MKDVYTFFVLIAAVTGVLYTFDKERRFSSGKLLIGLDIAHIGFGAAAGITGVLLSQPRKLN
jgi:hypothetical protein